jgi:hypothetical protein
MDNQYLKLAQDAMDVITAYYKGQQTLDRTTYCAMVVQLPNRNNVRAVVVAAAGKTAGGITGTLVDQLDIKLCAGGSVAIIPCADPTPDLSNDAEQQALRTVQKGGDATFKGGVIKAVVASRPICNACGLSLGRLGLTVSECEATAP